MSTSPIRHFAQVRDFDAAVYVGDDGTVLVGPVAAKPWKCSARRASRNGEGYYYVHLMRDGHEGSYAVHRLVAQSHVAGYRPTLDVHHQDGDKANNAADNLACLPHGRHSAMHAAELTEADVYRIRLLYSDGHPQTELARLYGVTPSAISLIVRGDTWTHVGGPITREGSRGGHNGRAKLCAAQVREIRQRAGRGESYAQLAAAFGVGKSTVCDIVRRRHWREGED